MPTPRHRSFRARWCPTAAGLLAVLAGGCDSGPSEPTTTLVPETVLPGLEGIAFGDGAFMGVGRTVRVSEHVEGERGAVIHGSDTVLVVRSTDGAAWTPVGPIRSGSLRDVAYGDGRWVAVGRAGANSDGEPLVLTSEDGVAWEKVDVAPGPSWNSVAHGNGTFVAVGDDPARSAMVVVVSADGLTWTETALASFRDARLSFGGARFVLWGEAGGVGVSGDGVEWEVRGVPPLNRVTALVHTGERWIGWGLYDCCFGEVPELVEYYLVTSPDGDQWQSGMHDVRHVVFDLGVLGGSLTGAAGDRLLFSEDGGLWRSVKALDDGDQVHRVACSPALCVAAGAALATSADLETWRVRELPHRRK